MSVVLIENLKQEIVEALEYAKYVGLGTNLYIWLEADTDVKEFWRSLEVHVIEDLATHPGSCTVSVARTEHAGGVVLCISIYGKHTGGGYPGSPGAVLNDIDLSDPGQRIRFNSTYGSHGGMCVPMPKINYAAHKAKLVEMFGPNPTN